MSRNDYELGVELVDQAENVSVITRTFSSRLDGLGGVRAGPGCTAGGIVAYAMPLRERHSTATPPAQIGIRRAGGHRHTDASRTNNDIWAAWLGAELTPA